MKTKIGFIINPISGMGGRVGLKGTDGVFEEALKLGAKRISPLKAKSMLDYYFSHYSKNDKIKWLTCSKKMGEEELKKAGLNDIEIVYKLKKEKTNSLDTKKACKKMLENNVDLILFCGGDGTARDIYHIIGDKTPMLGIPSGVKMHSGVFGINTEATAKMLHEFVNHRLVIGEVEILDVDEKLYRKGEWKIRFFGTAKGIVEPTFVQVGKTVYESIDDSDIKNELTEHIEDEMEKFNDFLFLFGPGGTIDYILNKLGYKNSILGIDAIYNKKLVGKDLNEEKILDLLKIFKKIKLVLSPIGAQGFILGRGNLQLSPKIIRKIGINNIIVISTPSKLISTPVIRVDTGDKNLDNIFKKEEFIMVVIGYRLSRVVKFE
ncbi:ATP-NAD kinase family protein [Thermoplasmatota archaeon]